MRKSAFIFLLTTLLFSFACKDTNSSESNTSENTTEANAQTVDQKIENSKPAQTVLYTWVDKLRLREKASSKSKVVAEMKEGSPLTFLNEKSDFTQKVNLRGTVFNEPWLKVKTVKGVEGWVYGGGVRPYKTPTDQAPSLYDKCFKMMHDGRYEKYFACVQATQARQLKKDLRYVEKIEDGLRFRLLGGNELELKNEMDEAAEGDEATAQAVFEYRYYIPKMGYFVVEAQYHEDGEYILVNDKSGKQMKIWGYPKPSPDHKHLLVTSADLEAGFLANGVQILGFTENGLEVIYEKEMNDFKPIHPKWIDENTIELTLISSTAADEKVKKLATIKRGASGEWMMD